MVDEGIGVLADRLGIRIVDRVALARRNLPDVLAELLRPAMQLDAERIKGDVR